MAKLTNAEKEKIAYRAWAEGEENAFATVLENTSAAWRKQNLPLDEGGRPYLDMHPEFQKWTERTATELLWAMTDSRRLTEFEYTIKKPLTESECKSVLAFMKEHYFRKS